MSDLFSSNSIDEQSKRADIKFENDLKSTINKKKPVSKIPEPQSFTKRCAQMVVNTKDAVASYYSSNKSSIEKSMKIKLPLYSSVISAMYSISALPRTAVSSIAGNSIYGQAIMFMYDQFLGPMFTIFGGGTIVQMFDFRTYKAIFSTFLGIIGECLPIAFRTIFVGLFEAIGDFFNILRKAMGFKSKTDRVMLTEAKRKSLLRSMFDWVKGACAKVLEKVGSTLWYVLKKGYGLFEYVFLKFINPIVQCVQKHNRLGFAGGGQATAGAAIGAGQLAAQVCTTLGFASLGAGAIGVATLSSGLWLILGQVAVAFSLLGYAANLGSFIEVGEVMRDAFDLK